MLWPSAVVLLEQLLHDLTHFYQVKVNQNSPCGELLPFASAEEVAGISPCLSKSVIITPPHVLIYI